LTFFILNEQTRNQVSTGKAFYQLLSPIDGLWTFDSDCPEKAIAVDESLLRAKIESYGIEIETISRGMWSGLKNGLTFQDVVIIRKIH
jgi:hypothetical protein